MHNSVKYNSTRLEVISQKTENYRFQNFTLTSSFLMLAKNCVHKCTPYKLPDGTIFNVFPSIVFKIILQKLAFLIDAILDFLYLDSAIF